MKEFANEGSCFIFVAFQIVNYRMAERGKEVVVAV